MISPTETEDQPEFNTDDDFTATATATATTTSIEEVSSTTTTTGEVVHTTNTVYTTDTTNTNKVINTPILSPIPTSNNYYDYIDNEILQTEYEGTIVFEDDYLAPTTICTDNPNNITIKDLLSNKNINTVVNLIDEDTLEYVYGMLLEDPRDEDTREFVCEIIMEALLSQDDVVVGGAGVCDSLFAILDSDKQ